MKRVVAFAVVFAFAFAVTPHAQERQDPSAAASSVPAEKPLPVVSKASINKAAVSAARAMAPAKAQTRKSFFKTPWPYVIAAAVVVIVVVAAKGSSSDGSGIY